jgi:hypothetical protein
MQVQVRALEYHPHVLKHDSGEGLYFLHASWRIDHNELLQSIGYTIHTIVWIA